MPNSGFHLVGTGLILVETNKRQTPFSNKVIMKSGFNLEHTKQLCFKLDQETWLCRTHLAHFVNKKCTILDYIKQYFTLFDKFGPVWTRSETFQTTWIILNRFENFVPF